MRRTSKPIKPTRTKQDKRMLTTTKQPLTDAGRKVQQAAVQLSTYERRRAALVKARAARAANRAAARGDKPTAPAAAKPPKPASAAQPTPALPAAPPAFPPYLLSPGWRITATSDGRNWLLQRQRGDVGMDGAASIESEDGESEDLPDADSPNVGTWADAGFYATIEGACRAWATRFARGVMAGAYPPPTGATDLPAVLAHVLARLEAACVEIGRITGRL